MARKTTFSEVDYLGRAKRVLAASKHTVVQDIMEALEEVQMHPDHMHHIINHLFGFENNTAPRNEAIRELLLALQPTEELPGRNRMVEILENEAIRVGRMLPVVISEA
jgi:hypothetical protein